ncbi:unnamed protein product [Mycena citricolor]|uniref:NADH dehydrogenase [ubiquinone] 1 beta subcomplex subunit 11, mitochondrial n=1 Tax=Mycena citricolor TaxID=2018698 RepID=A0AAD2Q6A1_9AGAR|nr:unnamed protein product [Mycena citricolor]
MLSSTIRAVPAGRPLARLTTVRYASHGSHYNEPTGLLFGEKPPPPGFQRIKQPWENVWYYGMYGTMLVGGVLMYFKPDTSIQTWALKEAKLRMEERGEKYQYEQSPSTSQ